MHRIEDREGINLELTRTIENTNKDQLLATLKAEETYYKTPPVNKLESPQKL